MDASRAVAENMALLRETSLLLARASALAARCSVLRLDLRDRLLTSHHWTKRRLWAIPADQHWTEGTS